MKRICILLIAAMALMTMTAFAETDLQAFEDANVVSTMHETYPSTKQYVTMYDIESGEVSDSYICYDVYDPEKGMMYAFEYPLSGDIEVTGGGEGYGYSAEMQMPFVVAFVMDEYEEEMLYYAEQNLGEFYGGEAVTEDKIGDDGLLHVTTEYAISEDEFAGYTLVARYTANPENLIITACEMYLRGEDGIEKLYGEMRLEVDPELKLPLEKPVLEGEERELHVITDPGTAEEFDYVFTAPIDMAIKIIWPIDYDLYTDAECTTHFGGTEKDEDGKYPATQTVYCAPITE